MHPSLETKVRCKDPDSVREVLREHAAALMGLMSQQDVYFDAAHGRLKLRSSQPVEEPAERGSSVLIAYDRPGRAGPRLSRFWVIPIEDHEACRSGLGAVLGVLTEVRKRREVWQVGSTTVHLDEVSGLGHFLELETSTARGPEAASTEHRAMSAALGIRIGDMIAGSYADLLLSAPAPDRPRKET